MDSPVRSAAAECLPKVPGVTANDYSVRSLVAEVATRVGSALCVLVCLGTLMQRQNYHPPAGIKMTVEDTRELSGGVVIFPTCENISEVSVVKL